TANGSGSAQQNLELLHAMVDVLVAPEQDLDAQKEFWAEDMIWHGPPGFGDVHGLEGFQQGVIAKFYQAFPDYNGSLDIEVADENWVAGTGYVTGTHEGDWLGIPATGKPVKMQFSDFWLIRDGKLAENWVMIDHMGVFEQIGVDPMTGKLKE
ncbi:MAG: ester cyclase, partial [Anaerolineae bacterium]|nr:ester cyclase [Anaerolineae bacterium]